MAVAAGGAALGEAWFSEEGAARDQRGKTGAAGPERATVPAGVTRSASSPQSQHPLGPCGLKSQRGAAGPESPLSRGC